jgi:hypothetical protein
VPEDPRLAAVVDQQRREEPDQRRLARAVLAEDRDAFAALDRERDVVQRRHPLLPAEAAGVAVLAPELLRQVDDFDGRNVTADERVLKGLGCCNGDHGAPYVNRSGLREREAAVTGGGART